MENIEAGAAGHGGRDANHAVVFLAELDHRFAEYFLPVGRRARFGGRGSPGLDIIRASAVQFLRMIEGGIVTFALLRHHMNHHGLVATPGVFQHVDQQGEIVTVNRPDVTQAHFLEDQAVAESAASVRTARVDARLQGHPGDGPFETLLRFVRQFQSQLALGQAFDQAAKIPLQPVIGRMRDESVQISRYRADVLGDAPFVVVEDADEALGRVGDVVERLEGNAVGQSRVAEDGDDVLIAPALVPRDRHAQGRRQCRSGMRRAVAIVLAFGAQGEAVQSARRADRVKAAFPAGKQFVDITLMADVPDELVFGRVENAVQGDRQFHHTQVRAEMTAVFGKDGDEFASNFLGQLLQLVELEFPDVFRTVHHVEVSVHKRRTGEWRDGVLE